MPERTIAGILDEWGPPRSVVKRLGAAQPARADNGRVTSHAVHIDIDVRIDGDQITGYAGVDLSSAGRQAGAGHGSGQ